MAATYNSIKTVTVGAGGAATILFDNIPQTYTDLVLRLSARSVGVGTYRTGYATINNNTTAGNYYQLGVLGNGDTSSSTFGTVINSTAFIGDITGSTAAANVFAPIEVYFYNYANTSSHKTYIGYTATENTTTPVYVEVFSGVWKQNSAITQMELSVSGSSFAQYTTASLYGILNA